MCGRNVISSAFREFIRNGLNSLDSDQTNITSTLIYVLTRVKNVCASYITHHFCFNGCLIKVQLSQVVYNSLKHFNILFAIAYNYSLQNHTRDFRQ